MLCGVCFAFVTSLLSLTVAAPTQWLSVFSCLYCLSITAHLNPFVIGNNMNCGVWLVCPSWRLSGRACLCCCLTCSTSWRPKRPHHLPFPHYSFFNKDTITAHKAITTKVRRTKHNTKTINTQRDKPVPPTVSSFALLASSCLYRLLASFSRSTCSCRSLAFTLSNDQGPGLGGIDV